MHPKITELSQVFERFKTAFVRKDFDTCTKLLSQLKVSLTGFKSLPLLFEATPIVIRELTIARVSYFRPQPSETPCKNRIAEFHNELELLSPGALENPCIQHAVELEQSFMEGACNRVLNARQTVPLETYVYFLDLLAETVRDEIAGCSEKAYECLSVNDARKMLLFSSDQELFEY